MSPYTLSTCSCVVNFGPFELIDDMTQEDLEDMIRCIVEHNGNRADTVAFFNDYDAAVENLESAWRFDAYPDKTCLFVRFSCISERVGDYYQNIKFCYPDIRDIKGDPA